MEPLPTQGQTLRHYTALRPRPRRTRTQPPSSRPQDVKAEAENEASEGMGRVDEGVEEFFTKKIIPDYALKGRWEESNPAQATPSESSSTSLAPLPLSPSSDSVPSCPESTTVSSAPDPSTDTQSVTPTDDIPPTLSSPPSSLPLSNTNTTNTSTAPKNIKKKFGDFFAFKRARAGKAAKAGGGEGGGESVKVKRTSIADLIRPLREAKDRERERYKERGAKSVDDVNVCNDAAITEGSAAVGMRLAGEGMDVLMPVKTLTITTPSNESAPTHPTTPVPSALTHTDHTDATVSQPDHPPEIRPEGTDQGDTKTSVERALRTKRSLREGKSQSLILLTGDEDRAHKKKNAQESTSSFEQRLQVMLHRISVGRSPPPDTKMNQNKEDELRKANSEGAILDKPDSPSYVKPRTMSTSAAERRDPKKVADPVRPLLHPKPPVPERPVLPKPPVSAKPILPVPAAAAGGSVKIRSLSEDGKAADSPAQSENQESTRGPPPATLPKTELFSPALRKIPSAVERSEKAQSVTDESLPKPRPHLKPPIQRRAVSAHEDTLAMTQELKAVLQRSPIRLCGNKGELPTCIEDSTAGEEAQSPQDDSEKQECEREQTGVGAKPKSQEREDSSCVSSATQGQKEKSKLPHTPVSPPPQDKSPTPALSKTAEKLQKYPQSQEKLSILASSEISKGAHVSPQSDAKKSPSMPTGGKERQAEDVSKQHTSNSASDL
ncbi:capping protein, Arp2/3 and myosin-I linker protein 2 [Periophthalmus magnuspinnatus]|uniref:capping protein, Arp2/3 and myosin-I linker protein 2 n=1 Tax=Periophthalmus magnuspinnatus TaxID=409849 RepID=UPI00145BE4F1|nr:capping protein, Arp2/3 and myosin-I linker protein 2 [Periophthalmus magnuspinnatus]